MRGSYERLQDGPPEAAAVSQKAREEQQHKTS